MPRKATARLNALKKEMESKSFVISYESIHPNDIASRYIEVCNYLKNANNLYLTNSDISRIALELLKLEKIGGDLIA